MANSEGTNSPQHYQKMKQQYLDPYSGGYSVNPTAAGYQDGGRGDGVVSVTGSFIPITAAGFPPNHYKIKKFSRETNYESDYSLVDTEAAFPQQPSSGETMDYKYKKSAMSRGPQQLLINP